MERRNIEINDEKEDLIKQLQDLKIEKKESENDLIKLQKDTDEKILNLKKIVESEREKGISIIHLHAFLALELHFNLIFKLLNMKKMKILR